MNRRALLGLLVCALLLFAAWLLWLWASGDLAYRPLPPAAELESTPVGYPWFGAVHVHSDLSGDASGSLEEIVAAAAAADLDFVVLSEHTRALGAQGRQQGGWYGDVLVVIAEEISTTQGHLLALGVPAHPYALGPTPRQALADVRQLGGHAFIAHPFGGEGSWEGSWSAATGAEVVSFYSALLKASEAGLLRALLAYPLNPVAASARVLRAPAPAIDLWDASTRLRGEGWPRRIAALGSVDAHGPHRLGVPSYRAAFEALQTMVWMPQPPDPAAGRDRIEAARLTEALAAGRSAIVLGAVGRQPAFATWAINAAGETVPPGEIAATASGPWTLQAQLTPPGPWAMRLLRDGQSMVETSGASITYPVTEPGTYRVEAARTGLEPAPPPGAPPWILSNPIYVWPAEAAIAARSYPAPPLPAPPTVLDLLSLPGWSAAGDVDSRSALGLAGAGMRWDLRLAAAEEAGRYAAVTWRAEGAVDWSAYGGLAVELDSAAEWRVTVRVWSGETEPVERPWEAVVAAGPGGRSAAVPWSDLLPAGVFTGEAATLGAQLGSIRGVALVVTPQLMRPGSEARIEVKRLGLWPR